MLSVTNKRTKVHPDIGRKLWPFLHTRQGSKVHDIKNTNNGSLKFALFNSTHMYFKRVGK